MSLRKKALYKGAAVKGLQIAHSFAQSDIANGHTKLVANAYHGSTLGRTVQLGGSERRYLSSLDKLLGLNVSVLSSRTIEHQ